MSIKLTLGRPLTEAEATNLAQVSHRIEQSLSRCMEHRIAARELQIEQAKVQKEIAELEVLAKDKLDRNLFRELAALRELFPAFAPKIQEREDAKKREAVALDFHTYHARNFMRPLALFAVQELKDRLQTEMAPFFWEGQSHQIRDIVAEWPLFTQVDHFFIKADPLVPTRDVDMTGFYVAAAERAIAEIAALLDGQPFFEFPPSTVAPDAADETAIAD